jgi:hypothetical protein
MPTNENAKFVPATKALQALDHPKTGGSDGLVTFRGRRILVNAMVYGFRAEAANGEPFLKDLLPISVIGLNAVARLGTLKQNEVECLSETLAGQGQVQVLTRPQLMTTGGRPASVQLGSKVPIVIPREGTKVAVEYRHVGLRLDVVPVPLGNGTCRLEMRCEMAEIDVDTAVNIGILSLPSVCTRMVDTAMELKPNESMVIALLEAEGEAAHRDSDQLTCTLFVATPTLWAAYDMNAVKTGTSPSKASAAKPPSRNANTHRVIR